MEEASKESHPKQLIFSGKSDCLGCAVLLCLVCLCDLACFFLSSFPRQSLFRSYMYIEIFWSHSLAKHFYDWPIPQIAKAITDGMVSANS